MTGPDLTIEEDTTPPEKPYWFCESCGHEDHKKTLPADRQAFYAHVDAHGGPTCPKCKSEGFMPVGY